MMKLDDMLIPAGYTVEQAIRKAMNDHRRSRQGVRKHSPDDAISYEITINFRVGVPMALAHEVLDKIEAEEAAAREKSNGQMA